MQWNSPTSTKLKFKQGDDLAHVMTVATPLQGSRSPDRLKEHGRSPNSFSEYVQGVQTLNKRFDMKAIKIYKQMNKEKQFNIPAPKPKEESHVVKMLLKRYPDLIQYNFFTESEEASKTKEDDAD
jgi:hypothetical protein